MHRSANSDRRLNKELKEMIQDPPENVSAGLVDNDLTHWEATILGPTDTPFYGGIFKLDIKFPNQYPFKPPKARFLTRVFHPNISESGEICLDLLNSNWSPALTIKKLLVSICSLLDDPNADDPLNTKAADLYKDDKASYNERVQEYVNKFATGSD